VTERWYFIAALRNMLYSVHTAVNFSLNAVSCHQTIWSPCYYLWQRYQLSCKWLTDLWLSKALVDRKLPEYEVEL